jgi:hypothetical protein
MTSLGLESVTFWLGITGIDGVKEQSLEDSI